MIRKNKTAFNSGLMLTSLGAVMVIVTTALFDKGLMSPVMWMITSGIGIYLPYILFHCLIFERLVALLSFKGNVGFLFYIADAVGYLGSVIVLFLKEVIGFNSTWAAFFVKLNIQSAAFILLLALSTMWYFNRRLSQKSEPALICS
ncbi:hypothetical protein D3C80_1316220 [compost metagenome]